MQKNKQSVINVIEQFLTSVGLTIERTTLDGPTFLPGVEIANGGLRIDVGRLAYPGDLLHEAGHLAVVPSEERKGMSGSLESEPGDEMMAIAWSWAALTHLGLDPEVVFHPEGYKGDSKNIIENFSAGRYFGVPLLRWVGMTYEPGSDDGRDVFPEMIKWLRD